MKKHWTEFLPPISSDHIRISIVMNEYARKIEYYEKFAREMRKNLEENEKSVLEAMREHFTEDEITAAIGKAMIHEINERQGGGQRITFTSLG